MRRSQPAEASPHTGVTGQEVRRGLRRRTALQALAAGALAGALATSPATGPAAPAHAAPTVTVTPLNMPIGSGDGGDGAAINDRGEILGSTAFNWFTDTPQTTYTPEYWGPDGRQINLNLPLTLNNVAGLLNRNGLIAGSGGGEAVAWIDLKATHLAPFACLGQGNCSTRAAAINDKDQIAVMREYPYGGGYDRATRGQVATWQSGRLSAWTDLGLNGRVNAMDATGTLVGERSDGSSTRAFVLSGGTPADLPSPGWPWASAIAINAKGQILGTVSKPGPPEPGSTTHTVIWQNGEMTDLGTLGGANTVSGGLDSFNDQGQVTGTSDLADGTKHAFLWQNGQMTDLDVGTYDPASPDTESRGWAINAKGQIIGQSRFTDKPARGFVWQNGSVTWLPAGVHARAINGNGMMTGTKWGLTPTRMDAYLPVRITITP